MSDFTPPLVDAMELFERFWSASPIADGDWTTIGADCECDDCRVCGMRYVLGWTDALLSNPDLADHAERLAATRKQVRG